MEAVCVSVCVCVMSQRPEQIIFDWASFYIHIGLDRELLVMWSEQGRPH